MYCKNCGKEVSEKAVACPACGVPPLKERNFCNGCGTKTNLNQIICTSCGISLKGSSGITSQGVSSFITKITEVPFYTCWIVNASAWVIFVVTFNSILEFLMGIACIYAFLIAKKHKETRWMYISIVDAVWMFAWAFGLFGNFRFFNY